MTTELGQCVNHGHVTERCCVLFERRRAKPFLLPAIRIHGDAVDIEGVGTLRRSIVDAATRAWIRRR